MARSTRDTKLETRTARLKLPAGKYHWRGISKGLAIGYWRGAKGGSWIVRRGLPDGRYETETLGKADDHQDADGVLVLDYFQAQEKARAEVKDATEKKAQRKTRYTVADAVDDYLEWYQAHRKAYAATKATSDAFIIPAFGSRTVASLEPKEIGDWHKSLMNAPPRRRGKIGVLSGDPDAIRRRKASANRILTVLKAALNHAWHYRKVDSDSGWRAVKPFEDVDDARKVKLTVDQCQRLINAAQGGFRNYVRAALYTGARPGKELEILRVRDFDADNGIIRIPDSKTGARTVYLNNEGVAFFTQLTAGRDPDAYLLTKDDGGPWRKNHYTRPMKAAVAAARLPKGTVAYSLRHTFITLAINNGMNLNMLADSTGTSVRMIQKHYFDADHKARKEAFNSNLPSFGLEPTKVRAIASAKKKRAKV